MMSERTELIKARREAEDSLVKTVIQLASALLVLLAGYAVGDDAHLSGLPYWIFCLALVSLSASVVAGLAEHRFSSQAYRAQQDLVEKFYTRQISSFDEPLANKWVKRAQNFQFFAFALSLVIVGSIALIEIGADDEQRQAAASPTASPTAATASPTAASATVSSRRECAGQPGCDEVSSATDASPAS